jgi:hypothetical protein
MIKTTRKAGKRKRLASQCDVLISALVLHRDGNVCVKCGKGPESVLQAAHVLSKGHYPRLRFELLNVLTLCRGCHIFGAHKDPADFMAWIEGKYPGRIELLRVLAATAAKSDLSELVIGLRLEVQGLSGE